MKLDAGVQSMWELAARHDAVDRRDNAGLAFSGRLKAGSRSR